MAVACGEYAWILIRSKGRWRFLDSTSIIGVGVHLVVGVFWRVVSIGSERLNLFSQNVTYVAILLDLLSTTVFTSCLFLDFVTAILWDSAYLVLVAMISGAVGVVFSVLVTQQLHRPVPGPANGDDGADVEDLSIFSNLMLATTL